MKTYLLLFLGILATWQNVQAQAQIQRVQSPVIRHKGDSIFSYRTLDSAILTANDGDVLYLPGGAMYSSSVTLNKKVTIFGTGYRNDTSAATGSTIIYGNFSIGTAAKGSFLMGIHFLTSVTLGANINEQVLFKRCRINSLILPQNSSTVQLNDCVVGIVDCTNSGNSQNVIITAVNCIFEKHLLSYYNSYHNQLIANNCIFLGNETGYTGNNGYTFISGFEFTFISNSIFFLNTASGNLLGQGTPTNISNCLIIGEYSRLTGIDTINNIRKDQSFKNSVLENRTDLFTLTANYNLKSNLQSALNNDVIYNRLGIYRNPDGTPYAFKATPPVHITQINVAFSTSGGTQQLPAVRNIRYINAL